MRCVVQACFAGIDGLAAEHVLASLGETALSSQTDQCTQHRLISALTTEIKPATGQAMLQSMQMMLVV